MFLFYLILFLLSNRTYAINISTEYITNIETMYPLPTNDQIDVIAAQFQQEPNWEHGNMPMSLTEEEETTPVHPSTHEVQDRPGVIKTGHLFRPTDMYAYRIDSDGVHPDSVHYVFLTRHGLYYNTEDESSSHLLRYGKYQARMAGHKINEVIREIIRRSGPVTRPIKLVSSTQTRAYETLYNIRLQLSNDLDLETEIIQDTGLAECVDPNRQRYRWLYFVREYLQPIKSDKPEHTITIIASHGNLLTSFDYIIRSIITNKKNSEAFPNLKLPSGTGISHAQTLLYRSIGAEPINLLKMFIMDEIPVTVNHAQIRRDFYYEWAAIHQCRSSHGREEMTNYIRTSILDHVFGTGQFENRMKEYAAIVYVEMEQEYETHLLPMMMRTCRTYLYRLPFIQANTDFGSFNRSMSPVPIPETEEEQRTPLETSYHRFSAYGMPFRVENLIQKYRKNPVIAKERIPPGVVHPKSRVLLFLVRHDNLRLNVDTGDEKTSHLSRFGINQVRGITYHIFNVVNSYMQRLPEGMQTFPIRIAAEPTVQSAESCFHIRKLLISNNLLVADQITDLGLQFNYFQKQSSDDFVAFQRVQILYMLRHYFSTDKTNSTYPSFFIHILCGDGRLFSAFRRELALNGLLQHPLPPFPTNVENGHNAMKHGNMFLFEAIGTDMMKLYETYTAQKSRAIKDEFKVSTDYPLQMSARELRHWQRSESGPCTLSYLLEKNESLAMAVVGANSLYQRHIARVISAEWNPYLAGLFIYACRLQLLLTGAGDTACGEQTVANAVINETVVKCNEQAAAGPGGDCS